MNSRPGLKMEREEMTVVSTQNVAQMQAEFDRNVVRVGEEEIANLKRLAKIYAAMSPEGAASIFHEMKDDDVVKVFAFMKDARDSAHPGGDGAPRSRRREARRADFRATQGHHVPCALHQIILRTK
jgi:hypothetical protein